MSADEKASAIKKVYDGATEHAKIDTLLKAGKPDWKVYTDDMNDNKKDYSKIKSTGITAKEYYDTFKNVDLDGNSTVNQYEAYQKLESTDFTTEQKAILWNKYNKAWKNNPYDGGYVPDKPSESASGGSGSSGGHSGSSKTKATDGLATKQVNALKHLNLQGNELSQSEVKAIIKLLARK